MKIDWVILPPPKTSGGIRTIVNAVNYLQRETNHTCSLYVTGQFEGTEEFEHSKRVFEEEYSLDKAVEVHDSKINTGPHECLVATFWSTAYEVLYAEASHKAYFIQDYEPYFYSMGDEYLLARNSYSLGLKHLTIGRWLSWKLQTEFDTDSCYFDFSANSSIYKYESQVKEKAICALYQPDKPRRCSRLLLDSLKIVKDLTPDLTIYLYGCSQEEEESFGFELVNLGACTLSECNDLYNKCQVGICISSSNPSRIPFEMMSSGLPVVDIFGENTSFDYPLNTVTLASPDPASIASSIINLLNDESLRDEITRNSIRFMSSKRQSSEFEEIASFFDSISVNGNSSSQEIKRIRTKADRIDSNISQYYNLLNIEGDVKEDLEMTPLACDAFEINVNCEEPLDKNLFLKAAVWCNKNQDDLFWYELEHAAFPGSFKTVVNLANHKNHSGKYTIHFYLADRNSNSMDFITERVRIIESSTPPVASEAEVEDGAQESTIADRIANSIQIETTVAEVQPSLSPSKSAEPDRDEHHLRNLASRAKGKVKRIIGR